MFTKETFLLLFVGRKAMEINMEKLKILAIVGSLRAGSYNLQLAHKVKTSVGERAEFHFLEHGDIPLLNEDIEFPTPEPVRLAREAVAAADGVWFFTPEYNHFFSGVLKNLIDWLSRSPDGEAPNVLSGKPAAISGITIGTTGTAVAQDHLVTLISYLNMDVMNYPRLTIPHAWRIADEGGKLHLEKSISRIEKQADAFLSFLQSRKAN